MSPWKIDLRVRVLREPELEFGDGIVSPEPKVGLSEGGPFSRTYSPDALGAVRLGLVGPPEMIDSARSWFARCATGILSGKENRRRHPDFRPFEEIFRAPLEVQDRLIAEINPRVLANVLWRPEPDQFEALLDAYEEGIARLAGREMGPNVIVCSLSDELFRRFRDWHAFRGGDGARRTRRMDPDSQQLSLFEEGDGESRALEERLVYRNFRRALKARAMQHRVPIQLAHSHLFSDEVGDDPATKAWDVCIALFYKAGGIPWRWHGAPPRTCFVGVSFHHLETTRRHSIYSSIAQAFASEIEGFVLRGEPVPWDVALGRSPHLSRAQAETLGRSVLQEYVDRTSLPPLRIVLHKRSQFDEQEIRGFVDAFPRVPEVEFVVPDASTFQLLPAGDYPPRRGTFVRAGSSASYLYTTGFYEPWGTSPGPYVPEPMHVRMDHSGDLERACREMLALTKMNFNSAMPFEWAPITTRMAGEVGPIMAEVGDDSMPAMSYRYYM